MNPTNTSQLAVRNTVWLALLSYLNQFIAFSASIFLARQLGPAPFGVLGIGVFWSGLLGLRAKFGLAQAAIRQPTSNGELLGTYYTLDLVLALTSIVLSSVAALVLWRLGYALEVALVIVAYTFTTNLDALTGPLGMTLERELQLSRLTLVSVLATIISYSCGVVLALAGAGLWSLLAMQLISALITLLGVYGVGRWRTPQVFHLAWRFNRSLARQLIAQGLPNGLSSQTTGVIVNQYDNFLIGTLVGATTLGFYDRAYRTSQWPNTLLASALQRVGFITFARVQNDPPRLRHAMRLCLWILTSLGVPMVLGLVFGARDLVEILYGPVWSASGPFLQVLALFSFFSPFIGLGTSLAYALGNVRTTVLIPAIQAATIVIVATPLALWLGSTGVLLGVGVTIAVGFLLSCRYIFRRLALSPREVFGIPVLSALIVSGAAWLMTLIPDWPSWLPIVRLGATAAVTVGGYFSCLFVFRGAEMQERIRYLVQTFRGNRPASQTI